MYILEKEKRKHPWCQPVNYQNLRSLYNSITDAIKMQVSNSSFASLLLNLVDHFKKESASLSYKVELHRTNTASRNGKYGRIYVAEVNVERRKDQLIVEPKVNTSITNINFVLQDLICHFPHNYIHTYLRKFW